MFTSLAGFGDQVFTALILILSAGITAQIIHGFGTRKAKETFIGLILLLMIAVQFYNLINAAIYVPASKFYIYNVIIYNFMRNHIYIIYEYRKGCIDLIASTVEKVF